MRIDGRPVGRNDQCPCGSGKKYKHCCERKDQGWGRGQVVMLAVVLVVLIGGLMLAVSSRHEQVVGPTGVWSEEHGHYH